MGRKMVEVKSLYELSAEDLNIIAQRTKSNYTRNFIQAVIQRYNGVETEVIAKNLSKCVATIINYINKWNDWGIAAIEDNRGNNVPSALTDEIVENIRNIVMNNSPQDFGYEQNRWSSKVISRYLEDNYDLEYSKVWITKLLKSLGFTYKRGVYKPTFANTELQESFKKNVNVVGYY